MLAKFAGRCGACGGDIRPGEEIESSGSGRNRAWVHAACAGAPALIPVPAGADAEPALVPAEPVAKATRARRP
ncbi:ribonuclease HI, partial [Jiangella rhizosphaerae]